MRAPARAFDDGSYLTQVVDIKSPFRAICARRAHEFHFLPKKCKKRAGPEGPKNSQPKKIRFPLLGENLQILSLTLKNKVKNPP